MHFITLFLLFVTVQTGWSQTDMKSTVFSDAYITDFLNKNFICTWKDIEKEMG